MKKTLTVIIPTYNMENYLRRCLDSLIISKNNMLLLEAIVINDGSKDSSLEIGRDYEKKYPGTFRIIDKSNGNYGSCINRGLKEAEGKYLKILDADDYFDSQILDKFISYLSSTDDDLVLNDYNKVDENNIVFERHNYRVPSGKSLVFSEYCNSSSIKVVQMHGVTYRTDNLRKMGYVQTEGISYTDQEWIFSPMTTISTFSYFDKPLYCYLIGREGQTMNDNIIAKSMGQFAMMVLSLAKNYNGMSIEVGSPIENYLHFKLNDNVKFIYNRALLKKNISLEMLANFDNELKKTSMAVYNITQRATIHRMFPYRFINYYRNHQSYLPFYVNWVYKLARE